MTKGHSPQWCVHYRSMSAHDTCWAGVNYHELGGTAPGTFHRLPCFLTDEGKAKPGPRAVCPKFRAPTLDEIQAWREHVSIRFNGMTAAILATNDLSPGQQTVIPCPICGAELHVLRTRSGRTHGCCKTKECLSWMG